MKFKFKKYNISFLLAFTVFLFVACNGGKNSNEDLSKKLLPSDTAVITGVLENGFKYYIRKNKNPENKVVFYLANKIGSVQEDEKERGVAHFVEHMAFKGTENFPENEMINFLEKSGVKFGADLNAHTSYHETVYKLPLPSNENELLNKGLLILKDWASGIKMTQEGLETERNVILAEMRQREGLDQRIRMESLGPLLNGAIYFNRSPVGTKEVVKNVNLDQLKSFYKKWYRPNLQAIIVVGDIDPKEMENKIKSNFAGLKNPKGAPELKVIEIPKRTEDHFQTIIDPEITNTTIQILHKFPSPKVIKTELELRNALKISLFNSIISNRINDIRRGGEIPFLSASVKIETLYKGLSSASMNVTVNSEDSEKGVKTLFREIRKVKEFGFNEFEVERAKNSFIENQNHIFEESTKVSSQNFMNAYVEAFIHNTPYPSASYFHQFYSKQIETIGLEELNECIQYFLNNSNRDFYLLSFTLDGLPQIDDLERWNDEVDKEIIENNDVEKSDKKLINNLPQKGQILQVEEDETLGITTWKLSNGAKVVLKPTPFRNDQILISSFSQGGTSLYSDQDFPSAIDAVGLLMRSGVGNHDLNSLSRILNGKIAKVSPYIGENYEGINAASSKKDLETTLQLIHLYFTAPKLDESYTSQILKETKDRVLKRNSKATNVYSDSIISILYNNHYRKRPADAKRIEQINPNRSLEIYKERFANAGDFTFIIVGSFEIEVLKPLVEQYIASLPSSEKREETKFIQYQYPKGSFEKVIKKGKTDRATVNLMVDGVFQATSDLEINMTAIRDILKFRMFDRLRKKENEVYSPSISLSMIDYSKRYDLRVGFVCAPNQVGKLTQAVKEELQNLAKSGCSEEELQKFKQEIKASFDIQVKKNEYWLGQIEHHLKLNKNMIKIIQLDKEVDQVSKESFKKYASKYLSSNEIKTFILLPE